MARNLAFFSFLAERVWHGRDLVLKSSIVVGFGSFGSGVKAETFKIKKLKKYFSTYLRQPRGIANRETIDTCHFNHGRQAHSFWFGVRWLQGSCYGRGVP